MSTSRDEGWIPTKRIRLDTILEGLEGWYRNDQWWNGWAIVALPRHSVDRVIERFAEFKKDDDPDRTELSWDGDTLVIREMSYVDEEGYEDGREEPMIVHGTPCWGPGNFGWVWSVDDWADES